MPLQLTPENRSCHEVFLATWLSLIGLQVYFLTLGLHREIFYITMVLWSLYFAFSLWGRKNLFILKMNLHQNAFINMPIN